MAVASFGPFFGRRGGQRPQWSRPFTTVLFQGLPYRIKCLETTVVVLCCCINLDTPVHGVHTALAEVAVSCSTSRGRYCYFKPT